MKLDQRLLDDLEEELLIQNTSLSFDPSVWTIFWPLSCGGAILLPVGENDKNPKALVELIERNRIKVLHAGPALLQALMREEEFKHCYSLEKIIGGGEAWPISTLEELKSKLPKCQLCNVYGPTEATIHVSTWCSEEDQMKFDMGEYLHEAIALNIPFNPAPDLNSKGECTDCGQNVSHLLQFFTAPVSETPKEASPFSVLKNLKIQK